MASLKTLDERTPNGDKPSTGFAIGTVSLDFQMLPGNLSKVMTKLERLDIGWIDILTAMANIAEYGSDEQMASVLEATALQVKRNRKILRDL